MLRSSAPPAAATLKSVSKSTSDSAVSVKPTVKAVTPTNASSRVPTKPISKQPSFNSLDQSATRKTPISNTLTKQSPTSTKLQSAPATTQQRVSGLPPKLTKTPSSLSLVSNAASINSIKRDSVVSRPTSTISSKPASSTTSSRLGTTSSTIQKSASASLPSARIGVKKPSPTSILTNPEKVVIPEHVPGQVDLALLVSKNNPTPLDMTPTECAHLLKTATHIRLDRSRIECLSGISTYTSITHLHLQYNSISSLKPLASLVNLRILCLASNFVSKVEGISGLKELKMIDLSGNLVNIVEIESFPQSLENVILAENPCASAPDYRLQLIYGLKNLEVLDEVDVTKEETRLAKMSLGNDEERVEAFSWSRTVEVEEISDASMEEESDKNETRGWKFEDGKLEKDSPLSPVEQLDGVSRDITDIKVDLEPFKSTVDAILERSKIRQAQNAMETRSRMQQLIEKIKADGKARTDRLKEVMASLN